MNRRFPLLTRAGHMASGASDLGLTTVDLGQSLNTEETTLALGYQL